MFGDFDSTGRQLEVTLYGLKDSLQKLAHPSQGFPLRPVNYVLLSAMDHFYKLGPWPSKWRPEFFFFWASNLQTSSACSRWINWSERDCISPERLACMWVAFSLPVRIMVEGSTSHFPLKAVDLFSFLLVGMICFCAQSTVVQWVEMSDWIYPNKPPVSLFPWWAAQSNLVESRMFALSTVVQWVEMSDWIYPNKPPVSLFPWWAAQSNLAESRMFALSCKHPAVPGSVHFTDELPNPTLLNQECLHCPANIQQYPVLCILLMSCPIQPCWIKNVCTVLQTSSSTRFCAFYWWAAQSNLAESRMFALSCKHPAVPGSVHFTDELPNPTLLNQECLHCPANIQQYPVLCTLLMSCPIQPCWIKNVCTVLQTSSSTRFCAFYWWAAQSNLVESRMFALSCKHPAVPSSVHFTDELPNPTLLNQECLHCPANIQQYPVLCILLKSFLFFLSLLYLSSSLAVTCNAAFSFSFLGVK